MQAAALAAIWEAAGLPSDALRHATVSGAAPVLPSHFAVATAAQCAIAAAGLAAATLHEARGGAAQSVTVDRRHACAEFRSERLLRVDGTTRAAWDAIAGLYPVADGWLRLHTNFPHHRDGILRLLACAHERAAVAAALRTRQAVPFEAEATEAGLCVAALRDFATWDAHPQGQAVPTRPLLAIERVGDAPARLPAVASRPLAGIRVLDLTRVIAGPVCARTLASHGAEVLRITAPHLPALDRLDIDTGRGKRAAQLDLRRPADRRRLADLVRGADVFVQGYRPGALAALGFGPEALARLRPGIVVASLSAYGAAGPWSGKRGFDSLVQTATGFNAAEAEAVGDAAPRPLPAQALDFATGHLLAAGTIAALIRRGAAGGSWHVQASLARTGAWLRGLGPVADGFSPADPADDDFAEFLEETATPFGTVRAVRPPAILSATPARFATPPVPRDAHPPAWTAAADPREARLARALRDNLARRKQQARARREP